MVINRVIPILLLHNKGLYKSVQFKNYKYVGDPINAVKIFNDKEVDELAFLDIDATINNQPPNYKQLKEIASECFMPLTYGGGIKKMEQIEKLIKIGVEKISINSEAFRNHDLIKEAVKKFGSSTIVVSVDIKKNFFGKYSVYIDCGRTNTNTNPIDYVKKMQDLGVGEILLNSINKDGTMSGYDLEIIKKISNTLEIPIVVAGGAGNLNHFSQVIEYANVNAVAAGSFFVFHGPYKAVLISYPKQEEIKRIYNYK